MTQWVKVAAVSEVPVYKVRVSGPDIEVEI